MLIGMMNNPRLDACVEARWAADHGMEFLDLTVEGPHADLSQIDGPTLRSILEGAKMQAVGHTAWFLPFSSPFARVRRAAVDTAEETFDLFASIGARWVNVHMNLGPKMYPRDEQLSWNAECFAELAERAARRGLRIMPEHPPDSRVGVAEVRAVLEADPRLGFHLDVGHAHVGAQSLQGFVTAFADRLAHVHLSDNNGEHDDHLPLGAGRIDWPWALGLLKKAGYDGTITLEVFSADREFLLISARKTREWWAAVAGP
jgi:sugar phosphate isomerase/epimerase